MKKAYLLAYSDSLGTRDQIKAYLSSMPEVITWRYDMPHAFYVISESNTEQLANALHKKADEKGRFIFVDLSGDKNGWLPRDAWYLINNTTHNPKRNQK